MKAGTPEYRAAALIHAARSAIEDALVQFNQFPAEWRPSLRLCQNQLLQMAQGLVDIISEIDAISDAWQKPATDVETATHLTPPPYSSSDAK